jgi:hypothetical protein
MELCDVKLKMSTSPHPQTDGSSEIMNRMLENYLRCYCSYRQDDWAECLPSAEFAYNSALSEDLGISLFEVDLGWFPVLLWTCSQEGAFLWKVLRNSRMHYTPRLRMRNIPIRYLGRVRRHMRPRGTVSRIIQLEIVYGRRTPCSWTSIQDPRNLRN